MQDPWDAGNMPEKAFKKTCETALM